MRVRVRVLVAVRWRQGPGNQKSTIMPWPKMAAGVGKTVVPTVGRSNGLSYLTQPASAAADSVNNLMFTLAITAMGLIMIIDTMVIILSFFFFFPRHFLYFLLLGINLIILDKCANCEIQIAI